VVADGAPLVLLSKLTGQSLKQRVTGADLVPSLAEYAAIKGHSIFMLGSDRDTARQAVRSLVNKYPGLKIAGADSPYIHIGGDGLVNAAESDQAIVDRINRAKPDILLLALGNPKQEIWFERNRYNLDVPVSIGIGGTLSFLAGTVKRAPHWMQSSGLEWIFRCMQEPKRLWKRYAEGLVKFGLLVLPPLVMKEIMRRPISSLRTNAKIQKLQNNHGDIVHCVHLQKNVQALEISSVIDFCHNHWQEMIIFNFSSVARIESTALARLIRLLTSLQECQRQNFIYGISPKVRRHLKIMRAFDGLDINYSDEALSQILPRKLGFDPDLTIWRSGETGNDSLNIYPQGNLTSTTLVNDPFGFQTDSVDFRPVRIHFDCVDKVDNAALVYLLDGIRRYGNRKITFVDPDRKLLMLDSINISTNKQPRCGTKGPRQYGPLMQT
jgi:exopolysaccharide biosynthesis WecB/TagA/CpsF family protein